MKIPDRLFYARVDLVGDNFVYAMGLTRDSAHRKVMEKLPAWAAAFRVFIAEYKRPEVWGEVDV